MTPEDTYQNICFWPISNNSNDVLTSKDFFPVDNIPKEIPSSYISYAEWLFRERKPWNEDIFPDWYIPNKEYIYRWLREHLTSQSAPYKARITTVAYALWVWSGKEGQ